MAVIVCMKVQSHYTTENISLFMMVKLQIFEKRKERFRFQRQKPNVSESARERIQQRLRDIIKSKIS